MCFLFLVVGFKYLFLIVGYNFCEKCHEQLYDPRVNQSSNPYQYEVLENAIPQFLLHQKPILFLSNFQSTQFYGVPPGGESIEEGRLRMAR